MQGRVGDSSIIGAGLYVDNEIGAASATGMGELVLTTLGSFLTVELRGGVSPAEACKAAVLRTVEKNPKRYKEMQVGYIAVNKNGQAYSIQPDFVYTVTYEGYSEALKVEAIFQL